MGGHVGSSVAPGDARHRGRARRRGGCRGDPAEGRCDRTACDAGGFDVEAIGREGRSVGVPVISSLRALRERVDDEVAGFVHYGATSQDVMDTAAMLVARRVIERIEPELDGVARACRLAEQHRGTLMAARTLMQHGLPTTFGLKAAGWLDSIVAAGSGSTRSRSPCNSEEPRELWPRSGRAPSGWSACWRSDSTWMSRRSRGTRPEFGPPTWVRRWRSSPVCWKIGLDVVLLSQTEVGEVAEPSGGGRGGSSTLPHKRNAIGSVLAIACARRRGAAGVLLAAMPQELERAAGAWQSEWEPLRESLALTGGAAAVREALEGSSEAERMRENLDATGGLLMAESVVGALGERLGRRRARAGRRRL